MNGVRRCYSDHNEDIRTKGSCDYCQGTVPDLPRGTLVVGTIKSDDPAINGQRFHCRLGTSSIGVGWEIVEGDTFGLVPYDKLENWSVVEPEPIEDSPPEPAESPRKRRTKPGTVYTGIRIPEALHARLKEAARERVIGVNLLMVIGLEAFLDRLPPVEELGRPRPPIRPDGDLP